MKLSIAVITGNVDHCVGFIVYMVIHDFLWCIRVFQKTLDMKTLSSDIQGAFILVTVGKVRFQGNGVIEIFTLQTKIIAV